MRCVDARSMCLLLSAHRRLTLGTVPHESSAASEILPCCPSCSVTNHSIIPWLPLGSEADLRPRLTRVQRSQDASVGGASRQHWVGGAPCPCLGPALCTGHANPLGGTAFSLHRFVLQSFPFSPRPRHRTVKWAWRTHCAGLPHPLCRLAPPTVPAPDALTHHAGQRRTARQLRLSLSLSAQAAHVHRVWVRQGVKEWVVFQKWRSVEMDGTLGLGSTASHSKEWPMTLIAVHCPTARASRASNAGKRPGELSATSVRTPSVLRQVFCSTLATAGACLRSSKRSST